MIFDRIEIINEEFTADRVSPADYDLLLGDAWRHFGSKFFRYNFGIHEGEIRHVLPLRVRVDDLVITKSQQRIIRKNSDLSVVIEPFKIDEGLHHLFDRHKRRFNTGIPDSIFDFVPQYRSDSPTEIMQVTVRCDERLVAASFFDKGKTAMSSIYGMFDPDITNRSLGIYTMLVELDHASEQNIRYYYHGYAYHGPSFYDYKKRFKALEAFDWSGGWFAYKDPK